MDIIVETTKGSNLKYKYDQQEKVFRLKKALPLGMFFPYDFGFIPGTKGEDGDPLDAMLISEFTFFTGASVNCRLIGGLQAEQTEKRKKIRNDRYFFVPEASVEFKHIQSIQDLGRLHNDQLKQFFINYTRAEGIIFHPLRMIVASKAMSLIRGSSK